MFNFQKFFQTTKVETVLFKMDYSILMSGMHNCHTWTAATGLNQFVSNFASTSLTAAEISSQFIQYHSIVMMDNQMVRVL